LNISYGGSTADDLSLTDISFLLPFLRVRYFSQLEARKLLDNFMTRRTKFANWFRNLDPADPKILDIFDRGYVCIMLSVSKPSKHPARLPTTGKVSNQLSVKGTSTIVSQLHTILHSAWVHEVNVVSE